MFLESDHVVKIIGMFDFKGFLFLVCKSSIVPHSLLFFSILLTCFATLFQILLQFVRCLSFPTYLTFSIFFTYVRVFFFVLFSRILYRCSCFCISLFENFHIFSRVFILIQVINRLINPPVNHLINQMIS